MKRISLVLIALASASLFADGMPGMGYQPPRSQPAAPQATQQPPAQPAQPAQPAAQPPAPTAEETFFAAVRRGDVTAARGFLDRREVNVNAREPNTGMTALMIATDRIDLPMVIMLIGFRPDPQARDNQGRTVGQIAAGKANPQLSATLAQAGY